MKYKGEIRGKLKIGENCCTEHIKIHPVYNSDWCLYPEDISTEDRRKAHFASLVLFDGRQNWECYHYRFADCCGWVVERKGLYLRMPEKDFEKFFGKWEIEERD